MHQIMQRGDITEMQGGFVVGSNFEGATLANTLSVKAIRPLLCVRTRTGTRYGRYLHYVHYTDHTIYAYAHARAPATFITQTIRLLLCVRTRTGTRYLHYAHMTLVLRARNEFAGRKK